MPVRARSERRPQGGVAIFPLTDKGRRRFGFADGASRTTMTPDPGFNPVLRNARFVAYGRCG